MFEVLTFFGFMSLRGHKRRCDTMDEAQAYIGDRKAMYGEDRMNEWGILFDVREAA